MPKHVGAFPIVGTLGQVNFYEDDQGRNVVRMKPGPSGKKVKTDKCFARTRKHNAEFKRATQYGAMVRNGFRSLKLNMKDSTMHYRLMQRIYEIMMMDKESVEGRRDLRRDTLPALKHFELNSTHLMKPYVEMPVLTDANGGLLNISAGFCFKRKPSGADAFKVKSVALNIDLKKGVGHSDKKNSSVLLFESTRLEMNFSHAYNEQLPLLHGMCIEFYCYDPLIDDYRLLNKELTCGFIRHVAGESF